MQEISEAVHIPDRMVATPKPSSGQVEMALLGILKSAPFRGSKQSQHLLQYIVRYSLEEHPERLKERVIGAEVFGRAIDYETNVDPIVRTRAAEVRKRLAQYYVGEGKDSRIRIELCPGSYQATFSETAKPSADHVLTSETLSEQTEKPGVIPWNPDQDPISKTEGTQRVRPRPRYLVLLPVLLVLMLAVAGFVKYGRRPADPLKVFWSPLIGDPKPVLIYTGSNPVYMPSDRLIQRFKASHRLNELESSGHEFLIPLSENPKLEPGDLLEMKDQFVTLGDVSANVRVSSLLTHFEHPFDLRSGGNVAFGDLRDSPVILIGAFNNTWTLQMTGDLPFVFGSGLTIRELSGTGRQWHPVISPENMVTVDYALVARLPRSKTGGTLITIAGITQSGTQAAAEFITSPEGIKLLNKSVADGWTGKNLEFVLETKVVNDIPTDPRVVASHIW